MTELLRYFKKTPEQQVERELVAKNTRFKSAGAAAGVGFIVCIFFAITGHEAGGIILGFFAFLLSLPFAGVFVAAHEKHASAVRLTERHEQRKREQEKAESEWQRKRQRAEDERNAATQRDEETMRVAADEQQRRDNRTFFVTKVHAATNTLIHYDASASTQERNRVKHAVASELSDISAQYTRYELTSLMERYPEVRSAVVALNQGLQAHGIDIPAATEIFRAMR
jgi:flagellar biosynthesis GTPase FlhF